jgi:tight adherence protein C
VLASNDFLSMTVFLTVFGVAALLITWVWLRLEGDQRRALSRLRNLTHPDEEIRRNVSALALAALPKAGAVLVPNQDAVRARLQARLMHAGLYGPLALPAFLGVKVVLVLGLPALTIGGFFLLGLLHSQYLPAAAATAAGLGLLAPEWWLDHQKKRRHAIFRQSLPDALDMLVLCLEGGVSLAGALQRVNGELRTAYPQLAAEMNILQREMQLGLSAGDAMQKFGDRCDLEEVRNLAAVILQSERFGAGIVKALRIHADTSRQDRQQRAEELAQKAAVKILFPTLLCIFPAIFIVILGPAGYQLAAMFSEMK